jgi:hypothetical protein
MTRSTHDLEKLSLDELVERLNSSRKDKKVAEERLKEINNEIDKLQFERDELSKRFGFGMYVIGSFNENSILYEIGSRYVSLKNEQ